MAAETNVTEKKEERIAMNEYSIYDYLKKTPSVLIATFSAIVAIVTFFSKAIAILSTQKQLEFWGIDLAFASFGGDSIVFGAAASVLYSFGIILVSLLFSATYDAYVPFKRCGLFLRYLSKSEKREFKQIKRGMSVSDQSEEERGCLAAVDRLQSATKEFLCVAKRQLMKNLAPIIFISCFVYLAYFGAVTSNNLSDKWLTALACVIIQVITFWMLSRITASKSINKKYLKQSCRDLDVFEKLKSECSSDSFPIEKLFSKGLRSVAKNTTIVIIVIAMFLNCCLVVAINAVIPASPSLKDAEMRIVSLDDVDYAIVYQIGDKYFLEKAVRWEKRDEIGIEHMLTVYKNQQRIISSNDISFVTYEFKEIIPGTFHRNPYGIP